jgi:hypothetical protein
MKILELLESYFEGLYHIGQEGLTLENLKIRGMEGGAYSEMMGKPQNAFWLAKGLSWHNWNKTTKLFPTNKQFIYRVKLKPNARILQIRRGEIVPDEFMKKHPTEKIFGGDRNRILGHAIDFIKISKKYDGVSAYHVGGTHTYWDVPSVALFNKNAIESITPMGRVRDVLGKKNEAKTN